MPCLDYTQQQREMSDGCQAAAAHHPVSMQCAPIQLLMGATDATGEAVASTRYASFSRLMSIASMIGRNLQTNTV